jgi:hypothetical protein
VNELGKYFPKRVYEYEGAAYIEQNMVERSHSVSNLPTELYG